MKKKSRLCNIFKKKKYELTDEMICHDGHTLHRIRALKSFGNVTAGELGGFIEKEENLSQEGRCWIHYDAKVYGCVSVDGYARIGIFGEIYYRDDYLCVGPIGDRFDHITFYMTKDDRVFVSYGCFNGSLNEFEEEIALVQGGRYLSLVNIAKMYFD